MTKKLKYHIIASLLVLIIMTAAYNFIMIGFSGSIQSRISFLFSLLFLEVLVNAFVEAEL